MKPTTVGVRLNAPAGTPSRILKILSETLSTASEATAPVLPGPSRLSATEILYKNKHAAHSTDKAFQKRQARFVAVGYWIPVVAILSYGAALVDTVSTVNGTSPTVANNGRR
jgi:hypothetical protein